ncbi:hypothetical protein RvY_13989 [Ramazzottius varieornatus]|uniref:RRM domain-containing protein n=1 Tax=Ramazzottius varieornatus TaxID=947166 RepID=A0A1D1VTP9_RAMVA|nr:hypothetical protein RvY_13989 [Ramazzottius varieornatus]
MAQNCHQSQLKACFLPPDITDSMFREMFCLLQGVEDCNTVRFTQRTCDGDRGIIGDCIGLGFIRFRSREDLDRALAFFERAREHFGHGILIDHKDVKVDVALPPTRDYCVKVVVFGIPDRWMDRELLVHFQAFGIVEHAAIDSNRRGHVIFHNRTSAEAAVLSSQNNTVSADGAVLRLRIHLASNLA